MLILSVINKSEHLLTLEESEVYELLIKNYKVNGVILKNKKELRSDKVILTAGTF